VRLLTVVYMPNLESYESLRKRIQVQPAAIYRHSLEPAYGPSLCQLTTRTLPPVPPPPPAPPADASSRSSSWGVGVQIALGFGTAVLCLAVGLVAFMLVRRCLPAASTNDHDLHGAVIHSPIFVGGDVRHSHRSTSQPPPQFSGGQAPACEMDRRAFREPSSWDQYQIDVLLDHLPAVMYVNAAGVATHRLDEPTECERPAAEAASSATAFSPLHGFQHFSRAEVAAATSDFSDSHKIGEGGFGSVYGGRLRGLDVAVKKLSLLGLQSEAELHRELEVLSSISHPHIGTRCL
jgi:hypothetical protein